MNVKISELSEVNELYPGCCFPIVQNGETKKVSFETLGEMLGIENNSIDSITTSIVTGEDGTKKHIVTISLTDGTSTTFEVSDGATGPAGPAGPEGKEGQRGKKGDTPVRGVDYWTAEDVEAIRAECEAMVEEQTAELQNEVDQLKNDLDNVLIPGEAEGENITLTDSAKYYAKISPKGKSTQETRAGINLLKNTQKVSKTSCGVTFTYNDEDGTYVANGTNDGTGNSAVAITYNLFLEAGTYYTIPTGVNGYDIKAYDGTAYTSLASAGSFTLAEDTTFTNVYVQIAKGVTTPADNFVFYPITSKTPVTVDTYERYGAMPSPEYPSEIISVESPVVIKSTGKNLFKNTANTFEAGGRTYTIGNGAYRVTGISVGENTINLVSGTRTGKYTSSTTITAENSIYLKAGEYMLSCDRTSSTQPPIYFLMGNIGDTWSSGSNSYMGGNSAKKKIIIENDCYITFMIYDYSTSSIEIEINNMQLEEGTEATKYEPYKENITSIPLLHDLRSLPNGTYDRIYKQNGVWYDEQNIAQVVLDGGESWGIQNTLYYTTITDKRSLKENASTALLSNYFKPAENGDSILAIGEFKEGYFSSGNINILVNYDNAEGGVDNFKSWLSTHNTEVIYELAEPIINEITDADTIMALENLRTYKGTTNITADAPISVEYKKDLETLFNNLQAQVLANEEV